MKRKFRWIDLALLPFMLCVGFLFLLGKLCGMTYKQISVVFNLWVQGAVLMLSGLAPAAAAIYKLATGGSLLWLAVAALLLVYAAVHVFGFVRMLQHYHLPFDRAFDLCVKDLLIWAKKLHTTYEMTNLIIFVLLFLVLIAVNSFIAWYIFNY
jgi:hypothetical protein